MRRASTDVAVETRPRRAGFPLLRPVALTTGWLVAALLAGMLLLSVVVRVWLTGKISAPWIMGDELIYAEQAKSFAESGRFLFREESIGFYSVYPALVSPAWLAGSMETTYALAKALNVVYMTLAALPLFFWGRRLVGPVLALIPLVLLLLMPDFTYTANMMTESAFLPVFVAWAWALARALETASVRWQLLALALTGAAVAVRLQAIVLAVIIPTAIVLKLLLDARLEPGLCTRAWLLERVRAFALLWGGLAAAAIAYVTFRLVQGSPLRTGLGGYAGLAGVDYSVRDASRWIVFHWGELAFASGVIPAFAFVLLAALAWARSFVTSTAERAFLAVAVASIFWLVVEVGTFASRVSLRIEERNMFYVLPFLFLALGVWLARGLPRPAALTAVAVLVPAALISTVPIESLLNISLFSDTFGLVPLYHVATFDGGAPEMRMLLGFGLVAAGLLFTVVPRRVAFVLVPLAVAVFLGASAKSVQGSARAQALPKRYAYGTGADPSWIDDAIGKDARAAFIYTPHLDADSNIMVETEFWNRSVAAIYQLASASWTLPGTPIGLDEATGRLTTGSAAGDAGLRSPYAVIDASQVLVGRRIAQPYRLALYRVAHPLRLMSRLEGVEPDGWTGARAAYTRYWTPRGRRVRLDVVVSREGWRGPDVPGNVTVTVAPLVVRSGSPALGSPITTRRWVVHSGTRRRFRLRAPAPPFRVEVRVDPTFSPSQFGSTDTRQLGVQVAFRVGR